jgi:hypothetical protein
MKTLGVIAGNGQFPFLVAEEARRQGYRVVIAGLEKEADPKLALLADHFEWVKIGALGSLIRLFKNEKANEAMMAGKVEKVRLFQGNVRPDLAMVKALVKIRDYKDDSLLGAVAGALDKEGIKLLDSTLLLRDALPGPGVLTKKKPGKQDWEDIRFGWQLAKAIAGQDVGQTVAVRKKAVMAVEAIEGTEEAIRRAGKLSGGNMTVVKVAKPKQDMRFDVPAFGMNTIQALIESRAHTFAFEAGKTIFFDRVKVIAEADKHGMILIGVQAGDFQ